MRSRYSIEISVALLSATLLGGEKESGWIGSTSRAKEGLFWGAILIMTGIGLTILLW